MAWVQFLQLQLEHTGFIIIIIIIIVSLIIIIFLIIIIILITKNLGMHMWVNLK